MSAPVCPRVCGEAALASAVSISAIGLSPRVRGKPTSSSPTTTPTKDYPRAYGEAMTQFGTIITLVGLSPRLRGSRDAYASRVSGVRSIPAPTGKPPDARYV